MTIQQFIKDPDSYNRLLTVGAILHAIQLYTNVQKGENLKVSIAEPEFTKDPNAFIEYKRTHTKELLESAENSTVEELDVAMDLMLSGWPRARLMEIQERKVRENHKNKVQHNQILS